MMAESPLPMDSAVSPPSTKFLSNGLSSVSHNPHTFPVNGIEFSNGPSEAMDSDSIPLDTFEDSFVDTNEYNTADDFIDPLELARIRHLSTIKEANVESSNSSSDTEDSDYIRLDEVSLVRNRDPSPSEDALLTPIVEENIPTATALSSNSEPSPDDVPVDTNHTDSQSTPSSPSNVTVHEDTLQATQASPGKVEPDTSRSTTYEYDEMEVHFESPRVTTPTVTVESPLQSENDANATHGVNQASTSPDLLPVSSEQGQSSNTEASVAGDDRMAPSPNGFLAMLSDVLAAPPVLDGNPEQQNEAMVQGTLSPPGDWLLPGEEQMAMDFGEPFLNLLPSVTPVEQCYTSDLSVCADLPSPQLQTATPNGQQTVSSDTPATPTNNQSANTGEDDEASNRDTQATARASGSPKSQAGTRSPYFSTNLRQRYVNVTVGPTGNQSAVPIPSIPEAIAEQPTGSGAGNEQGELESSTNLDHGVRTGASRPGHSSPLGPTLSSPGGSPVVLRRLIGDSPLSRRRNITSSPVGLRREELGKLLPLSPEHGSQVTDQYEFLRRTLSHSHRRYSTRRRPNRKGKNQEEGDGGEDPGLEVSVAPSEMEDEQRRWRDILISTEVPSRSEGSGARVDHHGRTYYMDHRNRTIAFDGQRRRTQHGRPSSDLEARREMLEKRYRSLNRSFRRNERPPASRRSQRAEVTSSTSNNLDDNLTLTLTREEAEAMVRRESTPPSSSSRSKSKKKRSTTGSNRRWPFSRKSNKSISQQGSTSGDDDILVISPSPANGEIEFRIPDSPSIVRSSASPQQSTSGSLDLENSMSQSLGVTSVEGVAVGVASEQRVAGSSESTQQGETVTELQQGGSELLEPARHISPEVSDLDRHDTIVRSSWLSNSDRAAARAARRRASVRSGVRRDSDEVTNEESPASRRSTVIEPQSPESSISPIESVQPDEEETGEKSGERELSGALINSPVLRFITRRDLFSFLSSAGGAGKDFIASRALMELVQRIRSDHFLLEKYQHSRHLVNALNKFADQEADLPEGWEKKLNQQGKVFFIDHKYKITTFIDPRLPLPDTVFTYSTHQTRQTVMSARRSALFNDEPEVRPHHITTVSSSTSIGDSTMAIEPTTPTISEPPTPTSVFDGDSASGGAIDSTPPTYEAQVVTFFRKPDVVDIINSRYQRGVRPQFRNIIEEIKLHGIPALERIQMSGSIAAYELALVLSLFEEDIGRLHVTTVQNTPAPALVVNPPPLSPPPHPTTNTKNTLQRKKEAFSTKLQHFKIMMVRMGFAQGSRLKFNIRRDHLLEDAYEHVMKSDIKQLQTKRLNIAFKGEEGLDYGGPSREFFFLLSREIFNPYYGLFEYSASDTYTVQVNPTSDFIQNSLDWFRFAGRVIGLVVVQGFLLDAFFTRTVYKAFLSRPPTLKDLEPLEPAFYNSLLWIRENDPEPLDLTFTVEEEAFGELRSHELKEGGLDLPVTEDNKEEYISLMLKWRLDRGVAKQMEVLKKGFAEVIPPHLLVDFDAHELEFITAGTVEIDIDDWRTHTEYRNGYHPAHPVIMWFWKAVEAFDNEQRLRLLQFVTGTSSVPFEGFKALRGSNGPKRFTIDYYNDINAFPRTHTCFNRIDLPPYSSYEVLYDKLLFAVQEGGGFGIE